MFFVVYIVNNCDGKNDSDIDGAFAVIPFHWIQNVEIHIKLFLNECMPNFNLGPKCFPEDDNYLCKLIKAHGN